MKFVYFNPVPETMEELKKMFTRLAKKHHPDIGGKTEDMQGVNAEYDILFQALKNKRPEGENGTSEKAYNYESAPEDFRRVIEKIINLDGIKIEVCGSWVWVTGNTYPARETLKAAGMQFSKSKKAWYWHSGEYQRRGRRGYSMEEIRDRHGSEAIETKKRFEIAG